MEKRKGRHRHTKRTYDRPGSILLLIATGLITYLLYLIFKHGFLGFRSLNVFVAVGLGLGLFLGFLLTLLCKAVWFNRLLMLLLSLVAGLGIFLGQTTVDLSQAVNQTARFSQVDLSVIVAADSPIGAPEELASLVTVANDPDNSLKLLESLKQDRNLDLPPEQIGSYQEAYELILADKTKGMVFNSAYLELLAASDSAFSQKIKTIYSRKYQKEVPQSAPASNVDVLNIYISGIDSYGPISGVSRSDVNIIMTINRKTKKVLLTTTPRDTYLPIAGGGQNQGDKLTHAGIYGVESSIQTLENLYGIDLHYYARLNFTSFLEMIDLVGGVEVDNDQEFTSLHGGYHFPLGRVTLTADQALGFVRERYSLQGGDDDRGKNQMKVIAALVKKLTSPEALTKFPAIIDGLSGAIQTDMPLSVMTSLANTQLEAGGSYQVTSVALAGTGSTGVLPSYAMPTAALYMLTVDEASLAQVKQTMQEVMEGR